jgi:hypothetical protein
MVKSIHVQLDDATHERISRIKNERNETWVEFLQSAANALDENGHERRETPSDEHHEVSVADDEPSQQARERDVLDGILEGWPEPPAQKRGARRRAGRRVLKFLRDRDSGVTRSDIVNELADDVPVPNQSNDTWWRKSALPALKRARDDNAVKFVEGSKLWRWVGD